MKDITLSIPKPCHEKWEDFQPTAQGGFCSACNKEVIDFTSWTDEQITNYFLNLSKPGCGKFKADRLKSYSAKPSWKPRTSWLIFPALTLNLLLGSRSVDATPIRKTVITASPTLSESLAKEIETDSTRTITGRVIYKNDSSFLPGVRVNLKQSVIETVTDADGRFMLTVPADSNANILVFSFIGMQTVERTIATESDITIPMTDEFIRLGQARSVEIVAGGVWYRPRGIRGIWWRIKNIF